MNNHTDKQVADNYESIIYMHDLKFDMIYQAPIFVENSLGIEYIIHEERNSELAFSIFYHPMSEALVIRSLVDNVKIAFHFPEEFIKHQIETLNHINLIGYITEIMEKNDDNYFLYFDEDIESYFTVKNDNHKAKLVNLLLDMRYIAIKFKKHFE